MHTSQWNWHFQSHSARSLLPVEERNWLLTIRRHFGQEIVQELIETLIKIRAQYHHCYWFWEILKSEKPAMVTNLQRSVPTTVAVSILKLAQPLCVDHVKINGLKSTLSVWWRKWTKPPIFKTWYYILLILSIKISSFFFSVFWEAKDWLKNFYCVLENLSKPIKEN